MSKSLARLILSIIIETKYLILKSVVKLIELAVFRMANSSMKQYVERRFSFHLYTIIQV